MHEHLRAAERMGYRDPRMHARCPDALAYVWQWFDRDLSSTRSPDAALSYTEIKAWSELTGIVPTAFETKVLRLLDRVYLDVVAEAREALRRAKG